MADAKGEKKSVVTLTRSPPEKGPGLPFLPGIYQLDRSAFALANFYVIRKLFHTASRIHLPICGCQNQSFS
jgi:hypothetical protein